jgi:Tannase and feruloyl esterase
MHTTTCFPLALLVFCSLWSGPAALAATSCESLAKLELPATTITYAAVVPAGTFTPPGGKTMHDLPAFCRIAGVIKPSSDSDIRFEVWLPTAGWNGKFQGMGNGGFAGEISYGQLGLSISHGYATASTDTGHEAGGTDARWALHHPEKIVDFGYRAIHETAVQAKSILHAFYGESPRRSYFSSCSNGGRQALMEAQRYPEDYDGIIAGAPANYWTHLLANAAWDMLALLGPQDSYISAKKLPAIQAAALAACDSLDGVKDGVIEDPSRCHFDPGVLLCNGPETGSCLTAPQLTALKKLYAGGRLSNGAQLFPGYAPGGEAQPGGWEPWITGPAPEKSLMYAFGTQFFKNMVFDDPAWDFRTFHTDRDTQTADRKMAPVLNANDPDLSRFRRRGGKLILYHGWSDAAIAAQNTVDYYRSVEKKMGARQAASFVRLFMVPGMQHCGGGAGPDNFGQFTVGSADPDHNIDAALERWVEHGTAPERIIAAKHKSEEDATSPILRTRPLCAYPLEAHYKGSGSTDDAANFTCAKPGAPSGK